MKNSCLCCCCCCCRYCYCFFTFIFFKYSQCFPSFVLFFCLPILFLINLSAAFLPILYRNERCVNFIDIVLIEIVEMVFSRKNHFSISLHSLPRSSPLCHISKSKGISFMAIKSTSLKKTNSHCTLHIICSIRNNDDGGGVSGSGDGGSNNNNHNKNNRTVISI